MRCLKAAALVATIVAGSFGGVAANERILTLDDALALARERAPSILASRALIDEAQGRLVGASTRLRENPVLDTAGGRRTSDGGGSTELGFALSQTFELGGRRGSRIGAAQAGVNGAEAVALDTERRLLQDVALAFYRVLHAEERQRLVALAESHATDVLRITEQRRESGDAPLLDENLAKAALARARSDVRAADGDRAAALGRVVLLLGLDADEPIRVRGDLRSRPPVELADLLESAVWRADLQVLEAGIGEAEAELRLGQGSRWPDFGLGASYEREEDASIVQGTLSVRLPFFERGRGLRAEANARHRRLRFELAAGRRSVASEVRTAFDVYRFHTQSVEELEREALALVDTNESMARRAYEEGQFGLAELLLIQREALELRHAYLERLLEAALINVELRAAAGALP